MSQKYCFVFYFHGSIAMKFYIALLRKSFNTIYVFASDTDSLYTAVRIFLTTHLFDVRTEYVKYIKN